MIDEQGGPIRVLMVDDHPMLREGTRALLERSAELQVVGTVGTGGEALLAVEELRPDVVILDVHLPDVSGIEVARRLRAAHPAIAILVLTGHDDPGYVRALLQLGVPGYLHKTATGAEIVAGVLAVAQGQVALTPNLLQLSISNGGIELTEREREVLRHLVAGQRNKDIAEAMRVSIKTVEFHVSRVLEKLGARSRAAAVRSALQKGLIDLNPSQPVT